MTAPIRATVLVPTHDHGPTLVHSVGSALAQTVDEIEIFVVGDGVPDVSRDVMADLCNQDKRVRFFDNPKGLRHGEEHRHAALAGARGRIVCYLSDDDLWLPNHVEIMEEALRDAEFAHAFAATIEPDQTFSSTIGDPSVPLLRDLMLAGSNLVVLSCAAHLLTAYQQLPFGWRPAPEAVPTDLYMWQQFLGQGTVRTRGTREITVLNFPTLLRRTWSSEERLAELEQWGARMTEDGFRTWLVDEGARYFRQEAARKLVSEIQWKAHVTQLEERLAHLEQLIGVLDNEASAARAEGLRLAAELEASVSLAEQRGGRVAHLQGTVADLGEALEVETNARSKVGEELERTRSTFTWRLRDRMLRMAWVSGLVRRAALRRTTRR